MEISFPGSEFEHAYGIPEHADSLVMTVIIKNDLPCCCVHGSQLFSNPVTNNNIATILKIMNI